MNPSIPLIFAAGSRPKRSSTPPCERTGPPSSPRNPLSPSPWPGQQVFQGGLPKSKFLAVSKDMTLKHAIAPLFASAAMVFIPLAANAEQTPVTNKPAAAKVEVSEITAIPRGTPLLQAEGLVRKESEQNPVLLIVGSSADALKIAAREATKIQESLKELGYDLQVRALYMEHQKNIAFISCYYKGDNFDEKLGSELRPDQAYAKRMAFFSFFERKDAEAKKATATLSLTR